MRVLIAPDGFTGTLSAPEVAGAMAEGWTRRAPDDVVELCPLSDGGPGFVAALHGVLGGSLVPVTVTSPLGEEVPATMLVVEDGDPAATGLAGGPTVYLEAAQAAGLALVPPGRRDPTVTTSRGVGDLVRAAVDSGARRVVVGVGGTGTNDGGAGMLAALGVGGVGAQGSGHLPDGSTSDATGRSVLTRGGGALEGVGPQDLRGLAALRRDLTGVDLVVAADVDVPLLGLHGASAGFAAQKGATAEQAQHLERCLGSFAHAVQQVVDASPVSRDLLAVARTEMTLAADDHGHGHGHGGRRGPGRLAATPGAGAGGGLGFGLAALGARLVPGARVVAEAVDLAGRARGADLLLTGEGTFDWQSLRGKVVTAVSDVGLAAGVPVVVLAGQSTVGRREWSAGGFSGVYAVASDPGEVAAALADPAGSLARRAAEVARTWSPRRP